MSTKTLTLSNVSDVFVTLPREDQREVFNRHCLQAVRPAKTTGTCPGEREEVRSQIWHNPRHVGEQRVARGC
jgi:hypothetical protein